MMIMSKKISHVTDSPCWNCQVQKECSLKRLKNRNLDIIVDMVWGQADYDRKDCPIWIAINAPEMVEED